MSSKTKSDGLLATSQPIASSEPGAYRFSVADLVLLEPQRFEDERGYFEVVFNSVRFGELVGQAISFVQDNESLSIQKGTVRGMHYQIPPYAQGKLVRVLHGSILDVAVDIRTESPTYLQHVAIELSAKTGQQFWIPPGFAHGFCTLEPDTVLAYKVTADYNAKADRSLDWLAPELGIDWPVTPEQATLSVKDSSPLTVAAMQAELIENG